MPGHLTPRPTATPLSGGTCCLRQRHPAAFPPTLQGILRSLRLLRTARCPRRPTSDCCAASLLRNRRRSSTPVGYRRHPLSGEPAAIEAAPPLIVQFFEIVVVVEVVVIVVVVDNKCRACHGARVFTLYVVILPLKKSRPIAGACVVCLSTVLV